MNKDISQDQCTEMHTLLTLNAGYCVVSQEQVRTINNKIAFLEFFESSMGIITSACENVGIARRTYYLWVKTDPKFAVEVERIAKQRDGEVEDRLFQKIRTGDGACIRFYLERVHSKYRQKILNEVVSGDRTLEDLIDEAERENEKLDKKENEKDSTGQQKPNTEPIKD